METPGLQRTCNTVMGYYVKTKNTRDSSLHVSQGKNLSVTTCEITKQGQREGKFQHISVEPVQTFIIGVN